MHIINLKIWNIQRDIYTKPVSPFCGDCMSHLKLMHSSKGEHISPPQFTPQVKTQTQGEKTYFQDCSYLKGDVRMSYLKGDVSMSYLQGM